MCYLYSSLMEQEQKKKKDIDTPFLSLLRLHVVVVAISASSTFTYPLLGVTPPSSSPLCLHPKPVTAVAEEEKGEDGGGR